MRAIGFSVITAMCYPELSGVQFWSEIILVISNRTSAQRSFDFGLSGVQFGL